MREVWGVAGWAAGWVAVRGEEARAAGWAAAAWAVGWVVAAWAAAWVAAAVEWWLDRCKNHPASPFPRDTHSPVAPAPALPPPQPRTLPRSQPHPATQTAEELVMIGLHASTGFHVCNGKPNSLPA